MKSNKVFKNIFLIATLILATAGITYAAFGDRGQILGSKFSVGSADIKLLQNNDGGTTPENLVDEMAGPEFNGITPNWQDTYLLKIFNNGSADVNLTSNAYYETINDPDDLRSIIFVEPVTWNDNDNNGIVDAGEEGESLGRKTLIKWKTEGYNLGVLSSGSIKSLILKFSTDAVSDTKQGKTGLFDFTFNSASL